MSKWIRRVLSILLVCILLGGAMPMAGITAVAVDGYGSNGKLLAPIEPIMAGSTAISTRAQLEAIKNNLSGNYHLMADIDLSSAEWVPIGTWSTPFTGFLDGQGHVIKNLKITGEGHELNGLFGYVNNGGAIKNVGLEGTYIDVIRSSSSAYVWGAPDMDDKLIAAGGICGLYSMNNYTSNEKYDISNCYNEGYISICSTSIVHAYGGGINGFYEGNKILNCYNAGNVEVSNVSTSSVRVRAYAGGISGAGSTNNCYNTGNVSATCSTASSSYSASARVQVGGISGGGIAENCYNTGKVSASATSSREAMTLAGGIHGNGNANKCYNIGTVSSSSTFGTDPTTSIGGISGGGTVSNCYNTGAISASVSASDYWQSVGGICGGGNVSNSYNTGSISVSGASNFSIGGIGGEVATATNSYTLNLYGSSHGTQLTTAQMKDKASFAGFNFTTVWDVSPSVNDGYPFLRNMPRDLSPAQTKIEFEYPNYSIPISGTLDIKAFITPVDFEVDKSTMVCYCNDNDAIMISEGYNKQNDGSYLAFLSLTPKKTGNYTITLATKDGSCASVCVVEVTGFYNIGKETYSFKNYSDSDSFIGHCFGMSATSSAYHLRLLDIATIGGSYSQGLYALDATSTVTAPICFYQARQGSSAFSAIVAGGNWYKTYTATNGKSRVSNITSDWTEVVNYVKSHAYDNKGSLQIGLRKKGEGGHAINFLRYGEVEGQPRIYAYDNEYPGDETYFYKDTQGMICQVPYSVFSGPIDCIALRDVSKYFSIVGGFDMTHVIYADEDVISVEGASVYPMDGDIEFGEHVMFEIPAHLNQVTITPLVDNATFVYLDTVYNFGEINVDTIGILTLATLDNGSISQNPSFSITESPSTIQLNSPSLSMNYKATAKLTATVTPDNETNKTVTWKSDNEKVATVDANGNVKAIGRGTAKVTATTEDEQKTATCEVTVKYAWWQWLIIFFLFGWIWY